MYQHSVFQSNKTFHCFYFVISVSIGSFKVLCISILISMSIENNLKFLAFLYLDTINNYISDYVI